MSGRSTGFAPKLFERSRVPSHFITNGTQVNSCWALTYHQPSGPSTW
jgi:hypothetical protein